MRLKGCDVFSEYATLQNVRSLTQISVSTQFTNHTSTAGPAHTAHHCIRDHPRHRTSVPHNAVIALANIARCAYNELPLCIRATLFRGDFAPDLLHKSSVPCHRYIATYDTAALGQAILLILIPHSLLHLHDAMERQ